MWQLFLLCACLQYLGVGADQLVLVHAVWRHGDRTPQKSYPNDPNKDKFPEGFGELTDIGAKQQQELGQWLRKRYMDEYKLLSSKYSLKYVYVRASNVSRTINSAKNNMRGMYNMVPKIPVEPRQTDANLLPYSGCRRSLQFREIIERTPEYKSYVKSQKPLFDRLTKLTGTKQTLPYINVLSDTIFIEKLKGMSIPDEIEELYQNASKAANKGFRFYFGYETGDYKGQNLRIEVPKSLGGPLLQRIIDRMQRKLKGETSHKYVGYSAHDTTIMNLLSTFGFNHFDYDRDEIPSYASVLLIELWERSSDKVPYLKVFYRRDKVLHELSTKISGCINGGCNLDQFIKRSRPYLVGDVKKFCNTPPADY